VISNGRDLVPRIPRFLIVGRRLVRVGLILHVAHDTALVYPNANAFVTIRARPCKPSCWIGPRLGRQPLDVGSPSKADWTNGAAMANGLARNTWDWCRVLRPCERICHFAERRVAAPLRGCALPV
jgi:hypothetical protein